MSRSLRFVLILVLLLGVMVLAQGALTGGCGVDVFPGAAPC